MSKLKIYFLIFGLVLVLIIFVILAKSLWRSQTSTTIPTINSSTESGIKQQEVNFHQLREIDLGEGTFANIIFDDKKFYVSHQLKDQGLFVNVYDQDFNFLEKYQLSNKEGADHQFVFNNGYFYLATPLNLIKFDTDFQKIKSVDYFNQLPHELQDKWPHGIDDMLLAAGANSLYLGIASGNVSKEDKNQKKDTADDLYLQKYNLDLELQKDFLLKDLGNTPGSSLIENNEGFTIITSDKHWNDSSLIAVSFNQNGNLLNKKTISADSNVNEEFAMGSLYQNGVYYVVYEYISGDLSQPTAGEPIRRFDVALKSFDQNWNLINQTIVTENLSDDDLREHLRAPHLAFANNKLYVAYSIVSGSPRIWVKEYKM